MTMCGCSGHDWSQSVLVAFSPARETSGVLTGRLWMMLSDTHQQTWVCAFGEIHSAVVDHMQGLQSQTPTSVSFGFCEMVVWEREC